MSPEQEHEARFALASFMRSDESFLRRVVDPRDLPLIDTYVDALASAPEEIESESESESKSENDGGGCSAITSSLSCPNRSARLAEARELRGQSAAFHASVAQLEASVAARKQANLEAAVCGAVGLGAGWPEALSLKEELRALVDGVAAPLLDLVTLENDQRDRPDELRIYVVSRATIKAMHASSSPDTPRLKVFQDLRKSNQLTTLRVTKQEVLGGALRNKHKVLAISYPWQGFGDPDSTNDRLDTVVAYLEEERPDIEYVWWDFLCVPQTTNIPDNTTGKVEHPYPTTYQKNDFDKLYFKMMINQGGVNLIYLGAYVLSIANALYIQRFWTQFEFYLGTRCVTGSAFGATRARLVVRCIQSLKDSTAEQASALFAKWGNKTTAEAKDVLAKKDVTVTNQSDKDNLLDKLPKLEALYAKLFLALPEEVRERLLAEQAREEEEEEEEERKGAGGSGEEEAGAVASLRAQLAAVEAGKAAAEAGKVAAEERLAEAEAKLAAALERSQEESLRAQLAVSEEKLAEALEENSALKEEVRALSPRPGSAGGKGNKVTPVF